MVFGFDCVLLLGLVVLIDISFVVISSLVVFCCVFCVYGLCFNAWLVDF